MTNRPETPKASLISQGPRDSRRAQLSGEAFGEDEDCGYTQMVVTNSPRDHGPDS